MSGQSCASDRQIAWQVVELPPGDWRVDSISEFIVRGFPARGDVASAKLPAGIVIHVGPGAIVYAGDFLFHLDPHTMAGTLETCSRDDQGAARALAAYPNLTGGFIYREPTHPTAGGAWRDGCAPACARPPRCWRQPASPTGRRF